MLIAHASTPLTNDYWPEIDISPELEGADASYYYSLVGVLQWIVELGLVDICFKVSMLSSHLELPRKGSLREMYHIFAYLKKHHNVEMIFDPSEVDFYQNEFPKQDWTYSAYECYELKEELPPNIPKPCGKIVTMQVYADSDHTGYQVTRRSRTRFIVFSQQCSNLLDVEEKNLMWNKHLW